MDIPYPSLLRPDYTTCQRCGDCCRRGGPALHGDDARRISAGHLRLGDLVTVRAGELSRNPLTGETTLVEQEFLKIGGRGRTWVCRFLEQGGSVCAIYPHRPVACRAFMCWEPEAIVDLMGRDLLTRLDVIAADDPLRPWIERQENDCPLPNLAELRVRLATNHEDPDLRAELAELVSRDLLFRRQVLDQHELSLEEEMFYFGRPLMTLLRPLGLGSSGEE